MKGRITLYKNCRWLKLENRWLDNEEVVYA